jgi:hypothetical protein
MLIAEIVFDHPTQASRVRLAVYQGGSDESSVAGLPDDAGFLCVEEWRGSSKVVKTLGFFPDERAARECLRRRADALRARRFQPIAPAA